VERTIIGRGDHCEVQLGDPTVSWDHMELRFHGSVLIATDLGSRNGSFLNGRRLDAPARVGHGDTLLVGSVQVEIAELAELRGATQVASVSKAIVLSEEERDLARALVSRYRDPGAIAPRPASRAELAASLYVSERTVQRRLDQLAGRLGIPASGRERAIIIAERVLQLGLDRQH
jgi:pSer/pThr/pTyr-binding forkhead associated (FHA) protein